MYTHRTHTYIIMLCRIFSNHNRLLVVHFVITSKIDATTKTCQWPTFVRIYVSNRRVRWIVLSLEIHKLCMIARLILFSGTTTHVYIEPTQLIVRNNHFHRKITDSKIKYCSAMLSCFKHTFLLTSLVCKMTKMFLVSSAFLQLSI